jgi:lipoprotein-anchoring transpeptidase ErfK/SrfK
MAKRTVSKTTARTIFIGTMAGAILLVVAVAGSGLFRGRGGAKPASGPPAAVSPPRAPAAKPAQPAVPKASPAAQSPFTVKRVLDIREPLDHGDWVWDDAGVPSGPMVVTIDMQAQTLSVFRGGYEIGVAVILYGATDKPTPVGTYPIMEKDIDHVSNIYDNAPMPYGLRLTNDGVFIHASDVKWGSATHGCIGIPKPFAKRLFAAVKVGDPVVITNGKKMDLSHL